jgi:glutamate-5-semialdehyde dehydrogenase
MDKLLEESRTAYYRLCTTPLSSRNDFLAAMKSALIVHKSDILAANLADISASGDSIPRLSLDESKFNTLLNGLDAVISLPDPLGRTTYAQQMTDGLSLYRVTCALGVVACVFEARPDAAVQIAALAVKAGNSVVLKGGREAALTNKALINAMRSALPVELAACITLIDTREDVAELLKHDTLVDLVIPRGSAALVRFIKANTKISVLGHADGICAVYVHKAADFKKAVTVVLDAKTNYVAACNAAETLLVDRAIAKEFMPIVVNALSKKNVEIRLSEEAMKIVSIEEPFKVATKEDFKTEFNQLIMAITVVDDLDAAIVHINTHGSHHTDAIITEEKAAAEKFMNTVDSAGVYWNASTRFADGFRYGLGAEVGVSTGKLHARGPMGLEGLTTYKFKLIGDGHTVSDAKLNAGHVQPEQGDCPLSSYSFIE